jgi:hypothetical protein
LVAGLPGLNDLTDFAAYQYLPALKRALGQSFCHLLALAGEAGETGGFAADAADALIVAALTSDTVLESLGALLADVARDSAWTDKDRLQV